MLTLIPRDRWEHRIGDLSRGLLAVVRPGKKGTATLRIPGLGDCIPARSGRAAIVTALKSLNLPAHARIGVPLYCCPVVFSAISAAGFSVRFIDVDPATFCMSAGDLSAKSSEVDAVIVVHLFGNACDVSELAKAVSGKPVIEDCAQALGARYRGRSVGSFGEAGVFSFRSGKYLSVGEGAALFLRQADARERASEFTAALPAMGRVAECRHMAQCYLKSVLRSRPLYGMVGYWLWNRHNKNRDANGVSDVSLTRICQSDFAITVSRLPGLDRAVQRQREIADFYSRTLKLDAQMLCAEPPHAYYNRYHYPVTFPSTEYRDRVADCLRRGGIDTMQYLDEVVTVTRRHFGYSGDCPIAERLAKRVLIIPGYHGLYQNDVEMIAQKLNGAWAELSSGRERSIGTVTQKPRFIPQGKA